MIISYQIYTASRRWTTRHIRPRIKTWLCKYVKYTDPETHSEKRQRVLGELHAQKFVLRAYTLYFDSELFGGNA